MTADVLARIYRLTVISSPLMLLCGYLEDAIELALIVEDGYDGAPSLPPREVICIAVHHEASNPVVF